MRDLFNLKNLYIPISRKHYYFLDFQYLRSTRHHRCTKVGQHIKMLFYKKNDLFSWTFYVKLSNYSQISQPVQISWLPSTLVSLTAGCSCCAALASDKTNFRPLSGEFGIKKFLEMDLKIDQEPHFGDTFYNMQGYCQVFTFLLRKTSFLSISDGLERGLRISSQLLSSFNEVRFFGRHWSKTQLKLWKWKFSWKKAHL